MEFTTTTLEGTHVTVLFDTFEEIDVTNIIDELGNDITWDFGGVELADICQKCKDFLKKEREEALDLKYSMEADNE